MELEKIKITDIVPSDYNPRQISDEEMVKLKNSLGEFGLVDPIIVNLKNNHIIGGHQRYEVLVSDYLEKGFDDIELNMLKLGSVGWIFRETDLEIKDDDHEKALNLALNKINGDWDSMKLKDLLTELDEDDFDLNLTGFDELELYNLNFGDTIEYDEGGAGAALDSLADEYDYPDAEKRVEKGEVWKIGEHILICTDPDKDCLSVDENLEKASKGLNSVNTAYAREEKNCYLIESNPDFCDIIIKKWEELSNEKARLL